jgi:hypothetical protein
MTAHEITATAGMQFADDHVGVRIAFAGNVFVSFFYGPPTVERLNFLFENETRWVANAKYFSAVSIIDPRTGKDMPASARTRAKEITQALTGRMLASATVVEGTGFFPALVRSVTAGIQIFSDRQVKWNVSTNTEDALAFIVALHTKLGVEVDADLARLAIARVRTG